MIMDYNRFDTETLEEMADIAFMNLDMAIYSKHAVNSADTHWLSSNPKMKDFPDTICEKEIRMYQRKYDKINHVLKKREIR